LVESEEVMAKKLCELCAKQPATVPDRARMGRLVNRICSACHAARLAGDMSAILDVKRREWETLSPEAQAKLRAMTGDPGPEYRRQQALGAERARKVPLGDA
jgi:cytochrome c5